MPEYRIEIYGYVDIVAKNRRQAMNQVKKEFEEGNLDHEDLSFEITYDSENPQNDND